MNTALLSTTATATMSSLTIAEITGKRHDLVLRDIREVLDQAEAWIISQFSTPSPQ